jgi:hypothetical protein
MLAARSTLPIAVTLVHDNYFEKLLKNYASRHHVKPGMTGWAQVNGLRGATPTVDLISGGSKWTCGTSTIGRFGLTFRS